MKYQITVVIVNWNGIQDTIACLNSLKKINKAKNMRVVVVDNGSHDDSVSILKKKYPWVVCLNLSTNLGFTGGNNKGIQYALNDGADYIWLLNNDTIVDKNALSAISVFDDPSVGAVGGKIYFAKGHEYHLDKYEISERGKVLWYAGGVIDWNNMLASHRGVDEVDRGQYNMEEDTPFITGCSFIVRSEIVRKIGALDNRYYLYLEDLDWSLRIQQAGYKTVYAPRSVVWHVNAGSSGKPGNPLHEYYFTRNRILFGFTYASLRTRFALIREAIRFIFGKSSIRRRAVFDAFLGKYGKQYDSNNIN